MGLKKPLSAKMGCVLHPVKVFQVCVHTHTQIHTHRVGSIHVHHQTDTRVNIFKK